MFGRITRRISAGWRRGGIAGISAEMRGFLNRRAERRKYRHWIREHGSVSEAERRKLKKRISDLRMKPLVSVIVPVYNVDEIWLRKCFDSVLRQAYENWELCIADDHSDKAWIRPLIEEYAINDERIKAVFREVNGHISRASNSALDLASGEYTVLLDHDDELSEDALYWLVNEANRFPEAEMFYSDEDLIDRNGERSEPKFKPDFSRDLFYSLNLITHLSAYKTERLRAVGGFRVGTEGSQDYDLALRVIETIPEAKIRHIPRILYHWRTVETSVAYTGDAKPYAYEKAREVLAEHFSRTEISAQVSATFDNLNRVSYDLEEQPKISMIVYGGEQRPQGEGADEYIEAEGNSPLARALDDAAEKATGDVLVFAGGGLEHIKGVADLAAFAIRPEIAVAGGKIVNGRGGVLHAGYVFTEELTIADAHRGYAADDTGNFFRNGLIGNYSAVSAELMAIRRELFLSAGGFGATDFPNALFDADLCLRLSESGFRIVFTPYTVGRKNRRRMETAASEDELRRFREKWAATIVRDPFYNPNFSGTDIFSIAG